MAEAKQAALKARAAAPVLGQTSHEMRNQALCAMAESLRLSVQDILAANQEDVALAVEKGTSASIVDRLALSEARLQDMARALEALATLPDPLGKSLEQRMLYNGLEFSRVSVPLGVVAMVYEARPNVTADAAGICIKSGNACVLRGGSLAFYSNMAIVAALKEALVQVGLPADCVMALESTDRAETDELLSLHGIVDVLIPRGGAGLINHCVEHAKVPVIETGTGNCHIYVQEEADFDKALRIIENAKTQRTGVCNACESVLIDCSVAATFAPRLGEMLASDGVVMHVDDAVFALFDEAGIDPAYVVAATEEDWGAEYLSMDISIKTVADYHEAIAHINRYGTGHSESIITKNDAVAEAFTRGVDAAVVYRNASTRFTDGGEFGLGAEIGISTQKLHVRGPFALEALTTYKYIVCGDGQIRG